MLLKWLVAKFRRRIVLDSRLCEFESILGYRFRDQKFLKIALSHKSFVNESRLDATDHNERFEFLGDAVLDLAVTDLLMKQFAQAREGDLSKLRASMVNETVLSELARQIKLGDYLYLGRGEEQCDGRNKNSLLADAFEAVLGGIYCDTGYASAFRIVSNLFMPLIDRATREDINRDYKTRLQEELQNRLKLTPVYKLVNESGPDHDKTFEVHVMVAGKQMAAGVGKSKKQAEQLAARSILDHLPDALDRIARN